MGIPLRPDPVARETELRRSFLRACVAIVQGQSQRELGRTEQILKTYWPNDTMAQRIVKTAQSPTSSADFPEMAVTTVLPMLAPSSAGGRLLALANKFDMAGLHTRLVPYVGKTGRPVPLFIAEGAPIPFSQLNIKAVTLGPVKKVEALTGLTNEMQQGSGDTAADVLGDALNIAVKQSLEAALLSSVAGDAIRPPGLLNGLTPIASAGTGGLQGMSDDAGLLAKEVGSHGINTSSMIYVTTDELAKNAAVLRPEFAERYVFASSEVADGTVIGIAPEGLAVGYSGTTVVETSRGGALHLEDTTPLDISDAGGVLAAPVRSMFQTDSFALRVRGMATWAPHPGAIAVLSGADW